VSYFAEEGMGLPLTRSFHDLVQKRMTTDKAFEVTLLRESINTILTGDVDTEKATLRGYIKATIGFKKLGAETGTQPKSLMRMFSPRGNPQGRNLFSVLGHLQKRVGLEPHVAQGSQ
jgi:DNA-binding phage protein